MIIRKMLSMFQSKQSFKNITMIKLLMIGILLLTSTPAFAITDVIVEIVKDQFWESLANFSPYDSEATKLENIQKVMNYKKFVDLAAQGDSGQIFEEATSNWSRENLAVQFIGKVIPELTEGVGGGPIGLLLLARDISSGYTEYMLNFYKDTRKEQFGKLVLEASKTPEQLTENYNKFLGYGIEGTGLGSGIGGLENIWAGILPADRKTLESEFDKARDKKMEQLKYEQRVKEAKQKIKERLKGIIDYKREKAEAAVKTAMEYLKAANMKPTKENISKMLKDKSFYGQIKSRAAEEAKKHPPVSIFQKPIIYKNQADIINKSEVIPPLPDFGELLKVYGDASDNLLNGNLESEAYKELISEVKDAASVLYSAVKSKADEIKKKDERENFIKSLNTIYENFNKSCDMIDKNLNSYVDKLKETLDGIVKSIKKVENPLTISKDIEKEYKNFSKPYSADNWIPPSLSKPEKRYATLKEFEEGYQELQMEVTQCNLVIGFINDKSNLLNQKIQNYNDFLIKARADYSEHYNKNICLAGFAGINIYQFKEEEGNLDLSKSFLVDGILSAINISNFSRIRGKRIRASKELREQTEINKKVIPEIEKVIQNEDPIVRCNIENEEKGKIITKKYLESYYNKHFKGLIEFVPYAYSLLSQKTWDDLRNDLIYNAGADLTYLNKAVDSPVYTTLENHRKKLNDFDKEIKQLKEIDLETRFDKMKKNKEIVDKSYSSVKQVSEEMKGFNFVSAELENLHEKFQNLHQPTYKALSDSTLSEFESVFDKKPKLIPLKMFEDVYNQYLSSIEKSEQFDKEALKMFEKYANYTVTTINPPDEYYRVTNTYGETNIPFGKIKRNMRPTFEVSDQYYNAYKTMKSNMEKQVDKARLDNYYKNNPIKTIFINGKEIDPEKLDLKAEKLSHITVRKKDLINSKIEIKGEIYPDAQKYAQGINISLDAGKSYEIKAKITGNIFTYSFEPEDEKVYWIKAKSSSTADEEANSFPLSGNGIGVYFTTTKSHEEILEIRGVRIQDINWNYIDGTLKLTKDELINGYVEITGYPGRGFGDIYENNRLIGATKLEINTGSNWQEVKWREAKTALNPWVFRFIPKDREQKISIRAVNPGNIYSDPMDFPPVKIIYEPVSRQSKIEEVLNKLKDSFERKDVSGFLRETSDDFYGGNDILKDQLRRFFDVVNTIRLYIVIDKYSSARNRRILDTHWERTIVSNSTSKQYRQNGNTTFVFDSADNKLLGIKGDSIFVVLSDDKEPLSGIEEKLQEQPKEQPKPKLPSGKITMYNEYDTQKGFSFLQGVLVDLGSGEDFYWNTDGMPGTVAGGMLDLGSKDIESIITVPTTGYQSYPVWIKAVEGHSYAVKTHDNKYGIIYIETVNTYPASIVFTWKYQTDGTSNFW